MTVDAESAALEAPAMASLAPSLPAFTLTSSKPLPFLPSSFPPSYAAVSHGSSPSAMGVTSPSARGWTLFCRAKRVRSPSEQGLAPSFLHARAKPAPTRENPWEFPLIKAGRIAPLAI